jgi:hypothetical protein
MNVLACAAAGIDVMTALKKTKEFAWRMIRPFFCLIFTGQEMEHLCGDPLAVMLESRLNK